MVPAKAEKVAMPTTIITMPAASPAVPFPGERVNGESDRKNQHYRKHRRLDELHDHPLRIALYTPNILAEARASVPLKLLQKVSTRSRHLDR
jgi:hypothetical protein